MSLTCLSPCQGNADEEFINNEIQVDLYDTNFVSLIIGCPDGCPCPSFECEEPEIDHDPVPVQDMHILLMPYENKERLHTVYYKRHGPWYMIMDHFLDFCSS